jgi:hypothetical protein
MPKPKPSKGPKASAAKPAVPSESAKAFAEVEPLLAKLSKADLAPINVDIPRAVAIAVGAVPHLAKLRDEAAKLPDFDITNMDRVGTYALAAWYAHLLALPDVKASSLSPLLEEAKSLRESMLLSAELLAHHGHFDKKAVELIRAGQGNLDTANDLVALAALFSSGWAQVEDRSPIEWADIERAAKLGPEILIALGAKELPGVKAPDPSNASERRARAFTLLVRAYDQCRRAATYLRWDEGDADEFAPSLFANRGSRSKPASVPESAPAAPESP